VRREQQGRAGRKPSQRLTRQGDASEAAPYHGGAGRAFLRELEGGCSVPAAVATSYDAASGTLAFAGAVLSIDGARRVHHALPPTACSSVEEARALGYVRDGVPGRVGGRAALTARLHAGDGRRGVHAAWRRRASWSSRALARFWRPSAAPPCPCRCPLLARRHRRPSSLARRRSVRMHLYSTRETRVNEEFGFF